jgi:hypothetical protein
MGFNDVDAPGSSQTNFHTVGLKPPGRNLFFSTEQ